MPSLGAVVVGIAHYRHDDERLPPLRYASADAGAMLRYLSTCWRASNDANLISIPSDDATLDAIRRAFRELAAQGPYDLHLAFFSGHAVVGDAGTGFVTQPSPGSSAIAVLEPRELDRLLASIPARRTILVLDCCHAEALTRRMEFFRGLDGSDARLFVASSREEQRTWEDDRVRHGIFTAHLLDLLNTGSSSRFGGIRDSLDVDGELFPALCEQVPLYVFEYKQQRQEPVKGGVAIRSVRLPVARASRLVKDRTALGTALRRIRQIVVGSAAIGLAALGLAYALTYYAEADRNGTVRLHHGTKWLAPVLHLLPSLRVDTGISFRDLSSDPVDRYSLSAGAAAGIWTHKSRDHYRAWYDTVRSGLDVDAAARYDILVGAARTRPAYRLADESRPSEVAFAAWALLDDSDPGQVDAVLGHVLGADRAGSSPKPFTANELDFDILDRTQPQLAQFADALRSVATLAPERAFTAYCGFLQAAQMWIANSSPEQHGEEARRRVADDIADLLAVIARARLDRGMRALDDDMHASLRDLSQKGYDALVRGGLGRVASLTGDTHTVVAEALAGFHGDPAEPAEAAALRELEDALDASEASQAAVDEVRARFIAIGGPEQSYLTAFLIEAADKQALSASLIAALVDGARRAVDRHEREFMDTEYARILAHAMRRVPPSERPVVYRLIDLVTADVTPLASSTAEIYAALGRQELDTPEMFAAVLANAHAAPAYDARKPDIVSEPLPGLSVVVGHGPWLTALAVIGAQRVLPADAVDVLRQHAPDPSLHDEILRALARQPTPSGPSCWQTGCRRALHRFAGDAEGRRLAAEELAERLATVSRADFDVALQRLREDRAAETEPEVRIALGEIVINAQLARVRTSPVGSRLFE